MPIYEYYCSACHGRFQHLAKRMDAPAPACPRCANRAVQRMVSRVNVVHGKSHHEQTLRQDADQINTDNPQAMAEFLQASGRLTDAEGVYGSRVYQELLHRRADGATDADMDDLVDDLVTQMRGSEATQMAGAVMFSEKVENRMGADGPPEDHDHDHAQEHHEVSSAKTSGKSRPAADYLGWSPSQ